MSDLREAIEEWKAQGASEERERIRQRIEALDRITSDYDGADGFLAADVLEALGGSDEH